VLLGEVAIVPALRCGEVQQGVAQEPIGPGLLAPAVGFEPSDYIGIQPHGDWLFFSADEIFRPPPCSSPELEARRKNQCLDLFFAALARMSCCW
jgi:hypothetical protein